MFLNGLKHLLSVTLVITDQRLTPAHVYVIHGNEVINRLFTTGLCSVYSCTGKAVINELEQLHHKFILYDPSHLNGSSL